MNAMSMMGKRPKISAPPFDNLMPYSSMKNTKYEPNSNSGCELNLPRNNKWMACDDADKGDDVFRQFHLSQVDSNQGGLYCVRKVIIDTAESLETFLNEGGRENSESSTSIDCDSLGDEGYSTDSPHTGLSSSSSSIGSCDGENCLVLPKPGILKRNSDCKKLKQRKNVTFMPMPKDRLNSSNTQTPVKQTLEQKIMALAIIDESCEIDTLHEGTNIRMRGKSASEPDKLIPYLTWNSELDRVGTKNVIRKSFETTEGDNSRLTPQNVTRSIQTRQESNYENIPRKRTECETLRQRSSLSLEPGISLPNNMKNQSMCRNSVACPYITNTINRLVDNCGDQQLKPANRAGKRCVTKTMSNNASLGSSTDGYDRCLSNFASSGEILRLFQMQTSALKLTAKTNDGSRTLNKNGQNLIETHDLHTLDHNFNNSTQDHSQMSKAILCRQSSLPVTPSASPNSSHSSRRTVHSGQKPCKPLNLLHRFPQTKPPVSKLSTLV